jgi:hypothetical protein
MLKKLQDMFQARESEYIYVTVVVNGVLEIQRKYLCLEYILGEKEKRLKNTILSNLNLTDYYNSYVDFRIIIVRDGREFEYKSGNKISFVKYDSVFLFLVKDDN